MADAANLSPVPAATIVDRVDPQLLKRLQPEQRERVLQMVRQVVTSFEGPLPPPEMLAEYDRLIPQGAERLMKLLEVQTFHRQTQEARLVQAQATLPVRGQIIGLILCFFFGAIGWNLAMHDHDATAGVLFGTTILGLVTVFVLGRLPRSRGPNAAPTRPKGKRPK